MSPKTSTNLYIYLNTLKNITTGFICKTGDLCFCAFFAPFFFCLLQFNCFFLLHFFSSIQFAIEYTYKRVGSVQLYEENKPLGI